jgi:hypothetical protein
VRRARRTPCPLRDTVSRTGRRVAGARARAVEAVRSNRSSHPRRQDYPPHASRQRRPVALARRLQRGPRQRPRGGDRGSGPADSEDLREVVPGAACAHLHDVARDG